MNGVAASLEVAAEAGIDPTREVYARIYARWPETERLFFRDRDHSIRDHMMFEILQAVIDLSGADYSASRYIANEWVHHVDDLQVSAEQYQGFFLILRDVVRDGLGPHWTEAMEQDWSAMLAKVGLLR